MQEQRVAEKEHNSGEAIDFFFTMILPTNVVCCWASDGATLMGKEKFDTLSLILTHPFILGEQKLFTTFAKMTVPCCDPNSRAARGKQITLSLQQDFLTFIFQSEMTENTPVNTPNKLGALFRKASLGSG